jgi:DNA-binding transcriptional LysR family regulator
MRDLDFTSLRLFAAVCEHRNIARAAEQEHIVASAVSKRLAQLEEAVGAKLLERGRRGVRPTPAGEALLEHARTILYTVERIENDVAAFGGGIKGNVRILATSSAIAESLLDDVATFMREPANRGIKIDIEERVSGDVVRSIREGSASLGICWDSANLEGLEHRSYRRDRLALAVHPAHPLAGRKALRFEQTLDYEHVGLPPSTAVHIMLQRAAARAGRSLVFRAIVSNFDAAFRVVAANLAISVIPVEVGLPYTRVLGVKMIPLADAWAERRFAICFRDFKTLQVPVQRMVTHLVRSSARARPESTG